MSSTTLSVVVPTLNGMATLPSLLDALRGQRTRLDLELVAIDSGSTDGSLELLERRCDRVIRIAPDQFNHGRARNAGIGAATGELVVMLVQDALPASMDCLAALLEPFAGDPALAGSFARQVPRPEADAVTRHYLSLWVAARDQHRRTAICDDELASLAPLERLDRCAFDNVCSCVRRRVWERHPFPEVPIAEDLAWSKEVLLAGYAIAFANRAVVVHSHARSARHELVRTRMVHRQLHRLFEIRTVPTLRHLARAVAVSLILHARLVRGSDAAGAPKRPARALALAFAWPIGQYLGGRDGSRDSGGGAS